MAETLSQRVFGVAAVAHAGFQLVVTLKLYPALVEVAAADWHQEHDAHSRLGADRVRTAAALVGGVAAARRLASGAAR